MKLLIAFMGLLMSRAAAGSSADYKHLGCFKDTIFRTMPKKLGNVNSVESCANLAKSKGYSTFGVQAGKECYSDSEAANKYKVFGAASNCAGGKGGSWANDVYQFPEPKFKNLGCYKDNLFVRALNVYIGKYGTDVALRTCADKARHKGYPIFGVQDNGWCFTGTSYSTYGNSSACRDNGLGGPLVNQVYQWPGQSCHSCTGKNSCTKKSCSEAFCYSLEADEVIGGVTSTTFLAGCLHNCTTAGKDGECSGKTNCKLTCCYADDCNSPYSSSTTTTINGAFLLLCALFKIFLV